MFSVVSRCLSVCVFMFCLVVLSFDHVQCGVPPTLCCVVPHNNRHTHHEHRHHTAQENSYKPLILIFRTKQTYQIGSKVNEHPRFFHLQYRVRERKRQKDREKERERDRDRQH